MRRSLPKDVFAKNPKLDLELLQEDTELSESLRRVAGGQEEGGYGIAHPLAGQLFVSGNALRSRVSQAMGHINSVDAGEGPGLREDKNAS